MLPNIDLIYRLLLAALLGSIIGLERERLLWAAGLRTHMLVCVGSCLIMIVSAFGFNDIVEMRHISLDPSRIAAQVVSGIGFLGAGAILLRSNVVRGLTTAASIWTVAGIGLAVGGGLYFAAIASTIIILIILAGIKPLEEKFKTSRMNTHIFKLKTKTKQMSYELLQELFQEQTAYITQFIVQPSNNPKMEVVTISLSKVPKPVALEMRELLANHPCVMELKDEGNLSS